MSATAECWAWEQHCKSSAQQFVLICLARHVKEGTKAHPSIVTISGLTRLAEKTVRHALKGLVDSKLVEFHLQDGDDPDHRYLSAEYHLAMPEAPPPVDLPGEGVSDLPGGGVVDLPEEGCGFDTPSPQVDLLPPVPVRDSLSSLESKKDSSPPYSPPPPVGDGGKVASPKVPRQKQVITLPADWEPPKELASEVTEMGVDPVKVTADIKRYWRLGAGQGTLRTLRGWNQTYLNRAEQLLQRGECLISRNAGGLEPWARRDADGNTWMVDRREGW